MKNKSSKTILVFFALGLISCAFCVQQAQADSNNVITIAGGAELNSGSVNTATQVTSWVNTTVQSASGSFAGLAGSPAAFTPSWFFNSGAISAFWTVGGFTFNLIASSIVSQGADFLLVSGTGIITGNGFDATRGNWLFSIQDAPAGLVFSWSGGSAATPDGGTTVALLGLALAGIEGIRRKLMKAKS